MPAAKSHLQNLRKSRSAQSVQYHLFLIRYKSQDRSVHAFFEGSEDEAVYVNHIQNFLPSGHDLVPYRCDNKSDVLKIFQLLDFSKFKADRVLFFVDKDLSDYLGEQHPSGCNLFVTDYYSIENYLVTRQMLKRIIREVFHNSDPRTAQKFDKLFERQYPKFVNEMCFVMAFIIQARKENLRANLNNLNLDKMFHFDSSLNFKRKSGISCSDLLKQVEKQVGCVLTSRSHKHRVNITKSLKCQPEFKKFVRGKYDIWFFWKFLHQVRTSIIQSAGRGVQAPDSLPTLKELTSNLGPRLSPAPVSLSNFLAENLGTLS